MWHGSDSLSICMHFTLAKCSGGVKIKILNLERGCCHWIWRFSVSLSAKATNSAEYGTICCFWPRCVSSGRWRRQQNLDFMGWLLPLTGACFFGTMAEAAKSWFHGVIAAFDRGVFLRVEVGGSKILISWDDCCLWTRRVSSDRRRRQQNLESWALLLLSALKGVFWSYLCPGDFAKQKISTRVLWIFVAFFWATIIYSFFCAWAASIKVRVCAQCWPCMNKNTQRCPELVIITESLQNIKNLFYFFAPMI